MHDYHDPYVLLRNDILSIPRNESTFGELKKLYESQINSNRTWSKINTILELINILEKRDFLNKDNINELKKIKIQLELSSTSVYSSKANNHGDISYALNIGSERVGENIPRANLYSSYPSRNLCDHRIKERVYKKIATEIGRKWIDLGRALKVSEHSLDELRDGYNSIEDRTYKILEFHENECDPKYWKSKLLDGLVEARRQDLKKKVQDIFDIYNS